jgi:hypothetical protein
MTEDVSGWCNGCAMHTLWKSKLKQCSMGS